MTDTNYKLYYMFGHGHTAVDSRHMKHINPKNIRQKSIHIHFTKILTKKPTKTTTLSYKITIFYNIF